MGLDMRPMGKPKKGLEVRFNELFQAIGSNTQPKLSFFDKIKGKKIQTRDEMLEEWFNIQIPSYETIKAPQVGRDNEANEWIKEKYKESEQNVSEEEFIKQAEGYYVIELAKETDGVPMYISMGQDRNVFRGQFLADCEDLIGEELVSEAWGTKLSPETLDYGKRLMQAAEKVAKENNLENLKDQRMPPESDPESLESKLHVIFSLAKWLIFYGENGHGYEADF